MSEFESIEYYSRIFGTLKDLGVDTAFFSKSTGTYLYGANVSDMFFWACSDAELVHDSDIPTWRDAHSDAHGYGDILYAARKRSMRPQGAAFTYIDMALWDLFLEAGPERETGLGNPSVPGGYRPEWCEFKSSQDAKPVLRSIYPIAGEEIFDIIPYFWDELAMDATLDIADDGSVTCIVVKDDDSKQSYGVAEIIDLLKSGVDVFE